MQLPRASLFHPDPGHLSPPQTWAAVCPAGPPRDGFYKMITHHKHCSAFFPTYCIMESVPHPVCLGALPGHSGSSVPAGHHGCPSCLPLRQRCDLSLYAQLTVAHGRVGVCRRHVHLPIRVCFSRPQSVTRFLQGQKAPQPCFLTGPHSLYTNGLRAFRLLSSCGLFFT